ncbi:uncharacterized protein TNCT_282991 [Trichonephila clavata]|uniref:Gustatory receptor n=1 Tax=Trichonephila clavata TaxID=2740835 RepID=A0A8X6KIY2_TRICU|nr:uncharacterized protein TNCT_282991 [Trichonephila clavata]
MEIFRMENKPLGFSYLFIQISFFFLWFSMSSQRRNLHVLLIELKSRFNILKTNIRRKRILLLGITIFICILPMLFALLYTYLAYVENKEDYFWSLELALQNKKQKILVMIIGEYMYFTVSLEYPCLFALSVCTLVHHYGLLILYINNELTKRNLTTDPKKLRRIISDFICLEKKISLLKDSLSTSLFIILLICFCNLFTVLSSCLEEEITSFLALELCSNGFTGVAVIFSLTTCCSKIPDYILRTKMAAKALIDKYVLNEFDYGKTVNLLKIIVEKDAIYLSAGDIVYFKKSFLLSAFGTLFTYGLLIMNFKKDSES